MFNTNTSSSAVHPSNEAPSLFFWLVDALLFVNLREQLAVDASEEEGGFRYGL